MGKAAGGDGQRIHYNEGKYMIDLRTMCSKGRSIRDYKLLYNAIS